MALRSAPGRGEQRERGRDEHCGRSRTGARAGHRRHATRPEQEQMNALAPSYGSEQMAKHWTGQRSGRGQERREQRPGPKLQQRLAGRGNRLPAADEDRRQADQQRERAEHDRGDHEALAGTIVVLTRMRGGRRRTVWGRCQGDLRLAEDRASWAARHPAGGEQLGIVALKRCRARSVLNSHPEGPHPDSRRFEVLTAPVDGPSFEWDSLSPNVGSFTA